MVSLPRSDSTRCSSTGTLLLSAYLVTTNRRTASPLGAAMRTR